MIYKFNNNSKLKRVFLKQYIKNLPVCGGNLTASKQEKSLFSHPQFGSTNYNDGHDCKWIISAEENKEVVLTSQSFHVGLTSHNRSSFFNKRNIARKKIF